MEHHTESPIDFRDLSKRAARRAIQRAFVLVGREKAVRQHLREVELTTLWSIEDWGLEWTIILDHARIQFHRGRAGRPAATLTWTGSEGFFSDVLADSPTTQHMQFSGEAADRRVLEPVLKSFLVILAQVLAHPVDDDGERLW